MERKKTTEMSFKFSLLDWEAKEAELMSRGVLVSWLEAPCIDFKLNKVIEHINRLERAKSKGALIACNEEAI